MRRIQGHRHCASRGGLPDHRLHPCDLVGAWALILVLAVGPTRAGQPSGAAPGSAVPRLPAQDPTSSTLPPPDRGLPANHSGASEAAEAKQTLPGKAPDDARPPVEWADPAAGTSSAPSHGKRAGPVWWEEALRSSILSDRPPLPLTLTEALETALNQAPELKALYNNYAIRNAEIIRQDSAFDWTAFVESIWNRDSNPVGSQLDGVNNRLRTQAWSSSAGIRRRNRVGGQVALSQDYGFLNSNSAFILPNNQGTARLGLQYEQPLFRGRGQFYNESGIRLAVLARNISHDELQIGVQDYLLDVTNAYWSLVLARGRYVQLVRSWERAVTIASEMENRVNVDVRPNQLNRVRTEVTKRWAAATDARYNVLRFQERLLRWVFGLDYANLAEHELVTTSPPRRLRKLPALRETVRTGLRYRSEVHQAIRRIRFASTELGIAENEVLPALNLVLSTYVAGLRGDTDIPGAYVDQFTEGEPGAGAGFNFQYPLGNRAAQIAMRQRRLAVARFRHNLQAVIAQVTLDVRDQATENNKYAEVLDIEYDALQQAVRDLQYLETRKQFLVDGSRVADLYLEDMLRSQDRLLSAEFSFLDSQIRGALAFAALARATGILGPQPDLVQPVPEP